MTLTIMGIDTSLGDASFVKIYTREDFKAGNSSRYDLSFNILNSEQSVQAGLTQGYDEYAEFNLPAISSGLTNANSPYIVEMTWPVGDIVINVRARLHIMLPEIVAVGNGGTILVSPDGDETWNLRNNDITLTQNINDITWADFKFIAVTVNGKVLIWGNQEEPDIIDTPVNNSLNSLAYGKNTLVAVGNAGNIIYSNNGGLNWHVANVDSASGVVNNNDLFAVSYSVTASEFMAVGSNGTYARSTDAINWEIDQITANTEWTIYTLNGTTFGNGAWVVVGQKQPSVGASVNKSVIFRENDTGSWEAKYSSEDNHNRLNDVVYGENLFIAVGNTGRILSSSDGISWNGPIFEGTTDLNSIIWDYMEDRRQFIIAGNNGMVITGNGGDWVQQDTDVSANLKGVTIRWEN